MAEPHAQKLMSLSSCLLLCNDDTFTIIYCSTVTATDILNSFNSIWLVPDSV